MCIRDRSYNNPLVDGGKNCIERRNLVLDRMLSNGYITQEEHDAAQQAPLEVNETIPTNDGILAYPYFTSYMRQAVSYTHLDVYKRQLHGRGVQVRRPSAGQLRLQAAGEPRAGGRASRCRRALRGLIADTR